MVVLLAGLALAEGLHLGVPVVGVEGLGPAMFQTASTGWHTYVEDGVVRIYVNPTEAGAHDWLAEMVVRMGKFNPEPIPDLMDEAFGDGESLLIVRDGNVGILVHTNKNAMQWAELVQAAILDGVQPWPLPPMLTQTPSGNWVPTAVDAVHTTYVGGSLVEGEGLVFWRPPRKLVVWDEWGRASQMAFGEDGTPEPDVDRAPNGQGLDGDESPHVQ